MLRTLLGAVALLPAISGAAPIASFDQPMATLARVEWTDPLNPSVVPLGQDRFLFDTRGGVRLWDARTAQWLPLKSDLSGPGAVPERLTFGFGNVAGLGPDTLFLGLPRDQVAASVWSWRTASQSLAAVLPLPGPEPRHWSLLALDAQHALACNWRARVARVVTWRPEAAATSLRWVADGDAHARAALQARGVAGQIQGFGSLNLATNPAERPPVWFDVQRCGWELTAPPPELAPHLDRQRRGDRHPTIKPYFLNDGRVVVPELEFFDVAKPGWRWLSNPLLWDAGSRQWRPLPALRGEKPIAHRSGEGEPVLSAGSGYALVEALHLPTLSWRRFNEQLPYVNDWRLEPLSTGEVLVITRGSPGPLAGIVGRITPSDGTVPAGRLHYSRSEALFHELRAPGRGLLLVGAGSPRQSDASEWVDAANAQSTELARLPPGSHWPAWPTGVALADASLLVLGGRPQGCAREDAYLPEPGCADRVGQTTWRYQPASRRWEPVPALRVPFSPGPAWQWGNSYRAYQWPRVDLAVRADGVLVWLQGGEFPDSREREFWPRATALMAWSPAEPQRPPRRIADLRKGRVSASLLTLADGRLIVVGGDAQLDRVALEKRCPECPDEFVSIGPMRPARSTEWLDESDPRAPRWVNGPMAQFPGGQAFRLANGRIIKLSLREPFGENGVQAEAADTAFTQWTRLPVAPTLPPAKGDSHADIRFVTAVGNRVLVLTDSDATLTWDDDSGRWQLHAGWPGLHEGAPPLSITAAARPGEVLVRYPRTVRLLSLPKP